MSAGPDSVQPIRLIRGLATLSGSFPSERLLGANQMVIFAISLFIVVLPSIESLAC